MIINQSGPLLNLTFVNPFYLSAKPPTLLDNCQERVGLTIFPEIDQPWKTTLPCQKKKIQKYKFLLPFVLSEMINPQLPFEAGDDG